MGRHRTPSEHYFVRAQRTNKPWSSKLRNILKPFWKEFENTFPFKTHPRGELKSKESTWSASLSALNDGPKSPIKNKAFWQKKKKTNKNSTASTEIKSPDHRSVGLEARRSQKRKKKKLSARFCILSTRIELGLGSQIWDTPESCFASSLP